MRPQFTEAIKFQDGVFFNLPYHQKRMDRTLTHFGLREIDLQKQLIRTSFPDQKGIYKCRVLYGDKIESIEFSPYSILKKEKVGVVVADEIEYSFKYADRKNLENLILDTGFDDIIIVKNGFVTDALFSNLVFESDEGLFTPSTYLLPGTKRQYLLKNEQIEERKIKLDDIQSYKKIRFINALIDLEDEVCIKIEKLIRL